MDWIVAYELVDPDEMEQFEWLQGWLSRLCSGLLEDF